MAKGLDGRKLPPGITQRANGLYMGRVMYNGETHTLYDRNLSSLKKKMTDLRYELEHGTYIKKSNLTIEDWFKEWVNTYKKNTVKQGTIDSYNKHFNAYIKNSIGKMKLADIRANHLQKLLNDMSKDGFSDDTIKLVSCILSGMFKQAFKLELIPKNPYLYITRPKGEKMKERVVFTKEQQQLYMKYAEKSYLCNLFQLAICTGMRNGELGGLLWSDVDFKNKVIHVNHTLMPKEGGGWRLDTPKTRTSRRDIPMIGKAYEILKRQEAEYKQIHGNITKMENDDFVFSVLDEPISRKRITHEIEVMLSNMETDNIEFPYFTLHSTRHTFATRCIENGMEPQVLKTILGHSTLAMTMDLYSHVLPDTKAEQMEKVASAF
jgi:integrase